MKIDISLLIACASLVCIIGFFIYYFGVRTSEVQTVTTTDEETKIEGLTYVSELSDFPTAEDDGIITLLGDHTYYITKRVDLGSKRLVAGNNTTIVGSSSEVSYISSNIPAGLFLLTSTSSLPLRNFSFIVTGGGHVLNLNASDSTISAFDISGVNFIDCRVGNIANYNNITFTSCAFIDIYEGMTLNGSINSIVFSQCLLSVRTGGTAITLPSTFTVKRRLRLIYSSFIISSGAYGLSVNSNAVTIPESYILDTCNFSGAGTYLDGVNHTSNSTLFINNVGINNTSVNGQMYMNNNALVTTLTSSALFYPIVGVTLASPTNSKYSHTSNPGRLTNDAIIRRSYIVSVTLSLTGSNNATYRFGIYDSSISAVREPSQTSITTSSGGRAESVHFSCVVSHKQNDYIEVWVKGPANSSTVTVTDMNAIITTTTD